METNTYNKDISFLMCSKRDYNRYGKRFVDSIYSIETNYTFEIIICHPDRIDDPRIKWIKDDKMIGASYAFGLTLQNSSGKYVCICVDDCTVIGDIYGVIPFLQSDIFKNRKYKITTLAGGLTDELTKPEPSPTFPEYLNLTNNYTHYPDCNVMCFPIALRETIDTHLGGFLWHPRVKACHDWWLGAYLAFNNEIGIQYNGAKYKIEKNNSEFGIDPILNVPAPRFFGESYVNTYRLMKNYKNGMPYVYDSEEEYLTEERLLQIKKEKQQ